MLPRAPQSSGLRDAFFTRAIAVMCYLRVICSLLPFPPWIVLNSQEIPLETLVDLSLSLMNVKKVKEQIFL